MNPRTNTKTNDQHSKEIHCMNEDGTGFNVRITEIPAFPLIVECYARNSLGATQGPTTIRFSIGYQGHGFYGEIHVKIKTLSSRGYFMSMNGEVVGNNTFATFTGSYNLESSKGTFTLYPGTHTQLEFDFRKAQSQPVSS